MRRRRRDRRACSCDRAVACSVASRLAARNAFSRTRASRRAPAPTPAPPAAACPGTAGRGRRLPRSTPQRHARSAARIRRSSRASSIHRRSRGQLREQGLVRDLDRVTVDRQEAGVGHLGGDLPASPARVSIELVRSAAGDGCRRCPHRERRAAASGGGTRPARRRRTPSRRVCPPSGRSILRHHRRRGSPPGSACRPSRRRHVSAIAWEISGRAAASVPASSSTASTSPSSSWSPATAAGSSITLRRSARLIGPTSPGWRWHGLASHGNVAHTP